MTDPAPLVSIVCESYNHEPFLRRCLDGFLMQQTDFPFEILVHDDASTDDSAGVIREYAERRPDLFRPIYQTENQYSKGIQIWAAIQFPRARGKYIALCEGDDYWTDPLKLQKEVDYLEAHPECAMVFGNAVEHWEDGRKPDRPFSDITDRDYDPVEMSERWIVPTATIVFRTEVTRSELYDSFRSNRRINLTGDLPLCLTCGACGTIHGLPDVFSVYRKQANGFMLSMKAEQRMALGDHRIEIYKVFGRKYRNSTVQTAMTQYRLALCYAKMEKNRKAWFKALRKSVAVRLRYPDIAVCHVFRILKERKARIAAS